METAICSRIALSPDHVVNPKPGALVNQHRFSRQRCHHRHASVPAAKHHQPWLSHSDLACLRFRLHRPTFCLCPLICATGNGANLEANPTSSAFSPDIQKCSGSINSTDGYVGLLVGMLGPDNDPLETEQAITSLSKYCQFGEKRIDDIISFPGCLHLVTSLLKSKSSSTFEAAVGLLQTVSAYSIYREAVAESGAIEEILNLLCQASLASEVKEQMLCTLWNLSTDESLRERIAKAYMLHMFVKFLDDDEIKVKEAAVGILANFALTLSLHSLMVEAGVIPKMADLLKNNSDGYKTIRKEAKTALMELSKYDCYRILIIEEGLVRVPVVGVDAYSDYKSPTHLWPSFPDGTEIERSSTPSRYGASQLLLGLNVCEKNFNLQEPTINAIVGRSQQQFLARVGAIEADSGRKSQLDCIKNEQYTLLPWIDGIARLVLILGLQDVSAITRAAHAIADASISEYMRISFKEAGAVRHLVQLLQHNSEVVQEAVAYALDRLSLSHIVRKTIEKEGVLKPLLRILEEPNTSAALLEKVVNILSRIFEVGSVIEMESYEEVIDGSHNTGSVVDEEVTEVPYPSLKNRITKRLQVGDHQRQPPALLCFSRVGPEGDYPPEERQSSPSCNSKEVTNTRKNLSVEFTCDSCGETTSRLIDKVAYEKGTIFLQCAGCLAYHRIIDNLGLVVEYDLREEYNDSDVKER